MIDTKALGSGLLKLLPATEPAPTDFAPPRKSALAIRRDGQRKGHKEEIYR